MAVKAKTKGSDYADNGMQPDKIKRYPLNTPEHTRAAASYFGMPKNRAKYSSEQQAHIMHAIEAAKKRFGIGEPTDKEKASVDALIQSRETNTMSDAEKDVLNEQVTALTKQIAGFTEKEAASVAASTAAAAELETLRTELAAVKAERDTLKTDKEVAAKDAAVSALIAELEAIKASPDDAAKVALKELASAALGDDKSIELLKVKRELEAAKELAAKAETPEAKAARIAAEKETASGNREVFSVNTPVGGIAPGTAEKPTGKLAESLDKFF